MKQFLALLTVGMFASVASADTYQMDNSSEDHFRALQGNNIVTMDRHEDETLTLFASVEESIHFVDYMTFDISDRYQIRWHGYSNGEEVQGHVGFSTAANNISIGFVGDIELTIEVDKNQLNDKTFLGFTLLQTGRAVLATVPNPGEDIGSTAKACKCFGNGAYTGCSNEDCDWGHACEAGKRPKCKWMLGYAM